MLDDPEMRIILGNTKPRSAVLSTSGTWFPETDTESLFRSAALECLNNPLQFGKSLNACLEVARDFLGSSCFVIPLGATQFAVALVNLIKSRIGNDAFIRGTPQIHLEDRLNSNISNHKPQLGRCKLAITGMAGRFPDAESHEALWELLAKGLDVHKVVPEDRFPVETHYDPTGKAVNTSHTPYGCWIPNPGVFDPRFFNMSPREAFQTDPMQRMALTTAYEALEMSGYVPNRTPSTRLDRIGTFYGQTSDDWREINAAQEVDTYFITGGMRAFGPGRINHHFGFSGPSLSIDTACSSSAAAFHVACTYLWSTECDTAIVGGLSCMTNPDIFSGLSRGQFLSKTGGCRTFDQGADGYCRADACASVIVKRLDDALADRDNILAIVLGTATNHSADAISITHPHIPTQSSLSSTILYEAGIDPVDVDYVEMHGTGTQAGDSAEMISVTNVFAPAHRKRPVDRPLYLGTVKSNVGHGEAASGVTALIKVLLMFRKNQIPPHVGIKTEINRSFPKDLLERNVNIALHMTPFERRDGKPRRVFVNNFSAAGGNTGLLLEDGPKYPPAKTDPRSVHVIPVTGKSRSATIRNAERLLSWMEKNPETPISHVAYTMTARRIQHRWRITVAASDLPEARGLIADCLGENLVPISTERPKVAFIFTGQGSHYSGLGKELYAHFGVFHEAISEFDRITQVYGFPSFLPLIDGSEPDLQKLSPVAVQLGLCCFEMALARLWASWGVKPDVVLGHSIGEYAALNAVGVLSPSDTIYLVGSRVQLLIDKCTAGTHVMLAIQGSVPSIMEALGARAESVNVACINGPRETVLSGAAEEMAEISHKLGSGGFKCTQLNVPFAFHSAQVEPILDEFEKLSQAVRFLRPKLPLISPLLGKLLEDEPINALYLRNHARDAVNFLAGLASAQQLGTIDNKTIWLEVGPHPVCANMVKAAFGGSTIAVPTLRRNDSTYKVLSASLCTLHTAGLHIDWDEFHGGFAHSTRLLDLPSYSFDEENYWLQYAGDWCLTKGRISKQGPALIEPPKPKLSTSSIHTITREELKGGTCAIETETDLSRQDTRNIVMGHVCNGAPLLPSTLYADMAMTICDYAYKLVKPGAEKIGYNVAVEVTKAFIFDENRETHIIHCAAKCNPAAGYADLVFYATEGAKRTNHATCKVFYEDIEQWVCEFDKVSYLIKSRVDYLMEAEKTGRASKISRGLAYKLFRSLVDYDRRYQGMEEIILESGACEATAKVSFQTSEQDGTFFFNPYWIDSCCHISGFIINGTDAFDSREEVFISHSWASLRFIQKLDPKKTYRSYIRMQPVKGTKMMSGDAYILNGDRIIGLAGDIRFQSIPRKILNIMLPPRDAPPTGMWAAPAAASVRGTFVPAPVGAKGVKDASIQPTPTKVGGIQAKFTKSVAVDVVDILAQEVGVSHDELADNIAFSDLGVDSLMSLTVCSRLREELDLEIDSHAFNEHPTIGAFKNYLTQIETAAPRKESVSSQDSGDSWKLIRLNSEISEMKLDSAVTTPLEESDLGPTKCGNSSTDLQEIIRATIATEMGVEVQEIVAAPDLSALGMDSLMSLSILGTLREKTGRDIPSGLFTANISLLEIEEALGTRLRLTPAAAVAAPRPEVSVIPTPALAPVLTTPGKQNVINTHPGNTTASTIKPPPPSTIVDSFPHRKATSVLLQGSTRIATHSLWMIPDGSGCATSYTEISQISSQWAVWGLFSPFMKTAEEYNCGIYGIAKKFIDEIKRRQPVGPYALAGWSAGGVIAYEIVNQLTKVNDVVSHLVIIDAPCPVIIEPLPSSLCAWLASIRQRGDDTSTTSKKTPPWLLQHFDASIKALSSYTAQPIPSEKCPKVMCIWCEDGICKAPEDPRPDPYPTGYALFLLDNRHDFGANRWDEYLNAEKIMIRHMPGNHFSMMHGDLVSSSLSSLEEGYNCGFDGMLLTRYRRPSSWVTSSAKPSPPKKYCFISRSYRLFFCPLSDLLEDYYRHLSASNNWTVCGLVLVTKIMVIWPCCVHSRQDCLNISRFKSF